MLAEIITIGDEILIGQTVDTNSAWIAKELNKIGISLSQIRSIQDKRESIIHALDNVEPESELVLMTGGLGPTKDDITKKVLADYFETTLKRDPVTLHKIEQFFIQRGREILETNRMQADLPASALILANDLGTASGMWFEKNGKVYVSMPGVPYEMKGIMSNEVLPRLEEKFKLPAIYYRTIMTEGIGESFLADMISDWESNLDSKEISIAYLPSPGTVKVRLGAIGHNFDLLKQKVDAEVDEFYKMVPNYIFGENDISQEEAIAELLNASSKTISTAESCTGGYLAHLLTSIAGSSNYYMGSVISYSNEVKVRQLGVKQTDLDSKGAVSQEVVEQMAKGVREKLSTDISMATSGIAGPDGGTEDKPVGTVWIALAAPEGVFSKKFIFERDRGRNIRRSSMAALSMLRRYLKGNLFD